MKERERTTIAMQRYRAFWRDLQFSPVPIPLTEDCVRRFQLMTEDCVVLDFTLTQPFRFQLGDRYNDELFGYFYLTKEQMPEYNAATGGYHYSLQLDREYINLSSNLFMLTTMQEGTRVRKETSWTLTGNLGAHMDEFMNNLQVLGYRGYSYTIEQSCSRAMEAHSIRYAGKDMLAALNALAGSYATEWWVEDQEPDSFSGRKIIHLGKCEGAGDPVVFSLDSNVRNMRIQNNGNSYYNKVYIYGSSDNLPLNYRKILRATVTGMETDPAAGYVATATDRPFTPDMFPRYLSVDLGLGRLSAPVIGTRFKITYTATGGTITVPEALEYAVSIPNMSLSAINGKTLITSTSGYRFSETLRLLLTDGRGTEVELAKWSQETASQPGGGKNIDFPPLQTTLKPVTVILTAGVYTLSATVTLEPSGGLVTSMEQPSACELTMDAVTMTPQAQRSAPVRVTDINGSAMEDTFAVVNYYEMPRWRDNGSANPLYNCLTFVNAAGQTIARSMQAGDVITLDTDSTLVPTAFYSTPYDDPTALARIGERRLMLPMAEAPGNYLQKDPSVTDRRQTVEAAVAFDDIYPDGKLKLSAVTAEDKTDYTKYEGETEKSAWQWQEYTFAATLANGQPFPFRRQYILPNETLRVRFLTPSDIGASEEDYSGRCLLQGMTFDLRYNSGQGTYTIVRNQDFGALLPNAQLYPQVGDPCVLIGWNVRALSSLGLVADAEQRLLAKGREYMAALEESQFTFECTMDSLFAFRLDPKRFRTVRGEPVDMKPADALYVRRKPQDYMLLQEGQRVTVHHEALAADKQSRIIGYTLKLDKPYDSPSYTVGETEAYSHLAQLEKEITNIK